MKAALVGLLEGANRLARTGWRPKRTRLFAFAHDEEVGGRGAIAVAEHWAGKGVQIRRVLDEGLVVTEGMTPGIARPAAYLGIAEKGYISLSLTARGKGGHSSMPPASTAIGQLASAIARSEAQSIAASMDGVVGQMFRALTPHMAFGVRFAFANGWRLSAFILDKLTQTPATNALVRTTQAVTMVDGGQPENELPQRARAAINFRVHPNDRIQSVLAWTKRAIDNPDISVDIVHGTTVSEPSRVAEVMAKGYRHIASTIRRVFPNTVVTPSLFIALTDPRHYDRIADDVYRFHPIRMVARVRSRIHGTNERIRVNNFREAVTFYSALIRLAGHGEEHVDDGDIT